MTNLKVPPWGDLGGKNHIMSSILIKNATIVNEGRSFRSDLLIKDEIMHQSDLLIILMFRQEQYIIDATGLSAAPGSN